MRPAAQIAVPLEPAGVAPARPSAPAVAAVAEPTRAQVHEAIVPAGLAGDWGGLAGAASEPNSFAESWFVAASLETLGPDRGVRLVEVRRGAILIGVMPLALERYYGRLAVPFVQNWCHHHLFLGTPLVRRGEEEAFWSALLALLDAADWAPNFLHVRGLVEDGPVHRGLVAAAAGQRRSCATVHRESRALLEPGVDAEAYYRAAVRPKKRKEIRRLQSRLAELGPVRVRALADAADLASWCDAFLAIEQAGWKGRAGTALACSGETEAFFRRAVAGARDAGKLQFLRLDLGERPIAMLVNFLAPPGGFSFKTCFDEDFARFSPGVLIQVENLKALGAPDVAWMDSCAAADHPMIDSLWTERRTILRATVRLKGLRRSLVFAGCRALESGSALVRRLQGGRP
jgi:CelD/BcsL family acetyltransferase involved in cellulose biosynthesis